MIVSGVDAGGKNIHMVIMNDGEILVKGETPAGINKADAAERLYAELLGKADLTREQIDRVVATGSGGKRVAFANGIIPDAAADCRGIHRLVPTARTIIDVGGEEARAIKTNEAGKVLDFAVNEKCAAGTGTFVEAMARALEMPVEEMATSSLNSTKSVSMNAQCAVFGESEVVSLIHQRTPKADIARAVHDAIAGRVASVARIIGLDSDVVMIGGMSLNAGFVDSLRRETGLDVIVPKDSGYVGALGAAIAASSGVVEEAVQAKVVAREQFKAGE
jgi:benzoyl-CoA reductase subunit D